MEIGDYWEAINNWHEKAKEEDDFFIKFILEYISFIAFLENIKPSINDRKLIQRLKRNSTLKKIYLDKVDKTIVKNLMEELEQRPIENVGMSNDRWWDCDADTYLDFVSENNGKLRSINDYVNIIEFIYRARNNLFHGRKSLNYERDLTIVRYSFELLKPLMDIILNNEEFKTRLFYEN